MGGFLLFSSIFALSLIGVMMKQDRRKRDRERKTYKLFFPSSLEAESVVSWLRSISGHRSRSTIAFELWSSKAGFEYRLKVPWQADYIMGQLQAHLPGLRYEHETDPPMKDWTRAVEMGLSTPGRPLKIFDSTANAIVASARAANDETVVMQWVISPARKARLPVYHEAHTDSPGLRHVVKGTEASKDEINERRAKLEEPNFQAVLRIGARANTDVRADFLISNVQDALRSTHTSATHFRKRLVTPDRLRSRIDHPATPALFPMQLSAIELAALVAWPIGNPLIPGLPPVMSRVLPAADAVPREGMVIGRSTFPGHERPIAIGWEQALMHTHVLGSTGCLHPDTPIHDPVTDTTKTVRERFDDGVPFHVYAMHGSTLVVAQAEPPERFHKTRMYRLSNGEHQIVVTPEHRVWNGQRYVEIREVVSRASSGIVRLPTISELGLSRLQRDAQRLMRTHAGSLGGCHPSHRLYGQQPRAAEDSGPVAARPPVGAQAPCCSYGDKDDLGHIPPHNHRDQSLDRSTKIRCARLSSHDLASASLAPACTGPRPLPSLQTSVVFESYSDPIDTTQQSDQSPLAFSSFSAPPSDSLLFNSYFEYSTFLVQQEADETYYDFHVPIYENYLAGGLINHNTGKSVTLAHMARQAMEQGFGVVLIETEGNLYQSVLDYVPKERMDDVILLDVSDYQHPVGFNVLDQGHPMGVIDQIMDLFVHKYGNMGVWAQEYLYHGLRTIAATPGLSFTDLATLLMPRSTEEVQWVDEITRALKDDELKRWWQRQDNRDRKEQQQRADPVLSRIWQLAARPELRYVMGQSQSAFKMDDVLKDNKILLVNLKGVSRDTASLAGTLVMNAAWQAVKSTPKEKPSFFFLDEFADFMDLPIDTESMLAQARKHSVGMVLANQNMGQLKPSVRDAVISNARNKLVLQINSTDAGMMIREFGKHLETDDFTHLQAYEAIAQVQTPKGVSSPMSIRTIGPGHRTGNAVETIHRSREKYAPKTLSEVHREIENRHKPGASSGPRPKIGFDD